VRCPFAVRPPLTLKALRAKDYSNNPQTLDEHLKKRRRELGLLQREAAEMLGISTDTGGELGEEQDRAGGRTIQIRRGIPRLRSNAGIRDPFRASEGQTA
jgi:hypothetical protein